MKKLSLKRRKQSVQEAPTRITNETVAEHRERILAGGRRFKYPMQYARHKLVINTIFVTLAALILIIAIGWWQLYPAQNTSTFFYRVVRILPLPVASVEGENVRYSDYLMYYKSSEYYLQHNEQLDLGSEDGKRQVAYIKRDSMNNAISDTYAAKLARELNISVNDAQVDQVIDADRNMANGRITQETYDASIQRTLNWGPDENRASIKAKLLKLEVSYSIDQAAQKKQEQAARLLQDKNADFDAIAKQLGGKGQAKVMAGVSGLVPRTNRDGGLSAAADKLKKGEISPVIKTTTGDGYYFVKLLERNDTQINYAYIRIPLTEFANRLAALKKDAKIKEYISLPTVDTKRQDIQQ